MLKIHSSIAMKYPFKRLTVAFSILTLGFFSGCANVIPPCGAKISPPSSELRDTKWELIRWNLTPNMNGEVRARPIPQGDAGEPIQIAFDVNGQRISGFSACNRFTARINEDERGLTLDQFASTTLACSPQRMELENDFLYELNDYRTLVRDGDRLLIIGRDRDVLSFAQKNTAKK